MKGYQFAILIYMMGAGSALVGLLHWAIPDSCHPANLGSALFFGIGFLAFWTIAFWIAWEHRHDPS